MAVLLACLALLAAGVGDGGDKRPVVLIFHSGGFIYAGKPMNQAAQAARRRGFEPKIVDYPLLNVPGAVRESTQLAKRLNRRGRTVYAYGESAGGTLALLLAERGLVRAASAQAPVADIPGWITSTGNDVDRLAALLKLDSQQLVELSPDTHGTVSPIIAEAPLDDAISPITTSWAARRRLVKAVSVPGVHLDPTYYAQNLNLAMRFLSERRRADRSDRPLAGIGY
jgi:hypothetical protein